VVCHFLPLNEVLNISNNTASHVLYRDCLDAFEKSDEVEHYYARTDKDSPTIMSPGYDCTTCYPYRNEPDFSPPSMDAVRESLLSDLRSL
jgi:hypothetical protein